MNYRPKVVRCRLKTGGKSIPQIREECRGQGLTYRDFENIQRSNEEFDGLVVLLSLWAYDNHASYHLHNWDPADDERMMMAIYYAEQVHPFPRYKNDLVKFKADWAAQAYDPGGASLTFAPADVETARFLIDNGGSDALSEEEAALVRRRDMERLQAMVGYCRTAKCLRGYILDYFGQPHADACGSCGNCRAKYRAEDITTHAQMILSCAVRIRDALGYGVGKTLLIQVLRGSRDQRVLQLRLDKLPTYGLLAELPESAVRARVEYLEMEGYLKTDPDHGALLLTPQAREVLFRGKTLTMPVRIEQEERAKAGALPPADADLFQALRATRAQIARRRGVPAYVVFSDATLADMARRAPRTMADFLEVSGVGQTKARQYGEAFLETIAAHAGEK